MTVTFITGCSTGIGRAAALYFARKGHTVFATMRDPERGGEKLRQATAAESLKLTLLPLDVDSDASVERATREAVALAGVPDLLINNAGIGGGGAVEETPIEVWKQVMETNFFGALRVTKAFLEPMRQRRSGTIVNVTSVAGKLANAAQGPYSASKFALEAASETLATELRAFGVRIIVIEPGVIRTPIFTKGTPFDPASPYARFPAQMGRLFAMRLAHPGPPELVAEVIDRAINDPHPKLRYPAGWDAEAWIAGRAAMSDEDWVDAGLITENADFDQFVARLGVPIT